MRGADLLCEGPLRHHLLLPLVRETKQMRFLLFWILMWWRRWLGVRAPPSIQELAPRWVPQGHLLPLVQGDKVAVRLIQEDDQHHRCIPQALNLEALWWSPQELRRQLRR